MTMVEHLKDEHTINRTFRLGRRAASLLEEEAKDRGLSENAIVNELILKNLRAERADRELKPILLPAMTVKVLLEELPDEKIIKVAKNDANDVLVKNIPLEIDGIMSPKSVLDTMKIYHGVIETEHDGKKMAIMAHYAGKKYSLLAGTMYKTLFALAGAKVEFSIDENAVVFDLDSIS